MGARTSPEMLRAQELLRQGYTMYRAAEIADIKRSTISQNKVCKEIVEQLKKEGKYGVKS
jgi:CRISPR/Cas system-associated protein endoribonuclease Cas2